MSDLPVMQSGRGIRRTVQVQFGGYDRSAGAGDGALWNTKNLTAEELPVLRPRSKRAYRSVDTPEGLFGLGDKLLRISDTGVICYDEMILGATTTVGVRHYAAMYGKNIILMPDKLLLNLAYPILGMYNSADAMKAAVTSPQEGDAYAVGYRPTDKTTWKLTVFAYVDGKWQENGLLIQPLEAVLSDVSVSFSDGTYQDVSAKANTLRSTTVQWADYFRAGDAVEISGSEIASNNKTAIVREVDGNELRFYENTFTLKSYAACSGPLDAYGTVGQQEDHQWIYAFFDGQYYHTFKLEQSLSSEDMLVRDQENDQSLSVYRKGALHTSIPTTISAQGVTPTHDVMLGFKESFEGEYFDTVTVARRVPTLEHCFGDENRLWGTVGSKIYGSKLGDPKNFFCFEGLSTDSYFLEVQTPGDFQAACSVYGYPTFFKTDRINKLYGTKPTDYQLQETACYGVKKGCGESLAIVCNALLFLSENGVMRYSGGYPERCDTALGTETFRDAVAGSDGLRYYAAMTSEQTGKRELWVLDPSNGAWIREQEGAFTHFAKAGERFYAAEKRASYSKLWTITGSDAHANLTENAVVSCAEFGDITMNAMNRKSLHRVQLRLEIDAGASVKISIQYDSDGVWRTIKTLAPGKKQSFYLPILPSRCDHFRIKLDGTGAYKLYSMGLDYRVGSEQF